MSLHYVSYNLAQPATMTLFTSARLGFGTSVRGHTQRRGAARVNGEVLCHVSGLHFVMDSNDDKVGVETAATEASDLMMYTANRADVKSVIIHLPALPI